MESKENINFIFQLNNKGRSGNFFVLFIFSGILFVGAGFLFVAIDQMLALIADIIVAVAYFVIFSKIKPSYFEMLVTESEMQVNYYSVSTTTRDYQSIVVPINHFRDYTFQKSLMGLKNELILSVDSKYGIADYPPISVSILKEKEIAQITHVFNEMLKK